MAVRRRAASHTPAWVAHSAGDGPVGDPGGDARAVADRRRARRRRRRPRRRGGRWRAARGWSTTRPRASTPTRRTDRRRTPCSRRRRCAAGTRMRPARCAAGTKRFSPVSRQPSPSARRRRGRLRGRQPAQALGQRRGQHQVARRPPPAAARPALVVAAVLGDRQRAEHDGGEVRDRRHGPADLLGRRAPPRTGRSRRRRSTRAGRGRAGRPWPARPRRRAVEPLGVGLDLAEPLRRQPLGRGCGRRGRATAVCSSSSWKSIVVSPTSAGSGACPGRTWR